MVGCGWVEHNGVLGVGADWGQNYSEAPSGEGRGQYWLLGRGVAEEGVES